MIRRLRPGDERQQVELVRRMKEHVPTEEQARAFLADDANVLLVAEDDGGRVVGFALAYTIERWDGRRHLFFYEIEVDEPHRRRGHGRALVAELVRIARDAGAFEMWVETERDNAPANALYERAGAEREVVAQSWVWKL